MPCNKLAFKLKSSRAQLPQTPLPSRYDTMHSKLSQRSLHLENSLSSFIWSRWVERISAKISHYAERKDLSRCVTGSTVLDIYIKAPIKKNHFEFRSVWLLEKILIKRECCDIEKTYFSSVVHNLMAFLYIEMDSERDILSQSRRQSTSLTFIPWTAWSCKNYEQGERESFCIKLIFLHQFQLWIPI